MLVVVTYDVSTVSAAGRRRLRRVAKTCLDYGQRVQNSVFECVVDPKQLTQLRLRLLDEMEADEDSVRLYFLGSNYDHRVEHYGVKEVPDLRGPLIL